MKRAMSDSLTLKNDFSGEFHLATKKQIITDEKLQLSSEYKNYFWQRTH